MNNSKTFRLIRRGPSFLEGASVLIDINLNISDKFCVEKSDNDADTKSLKSDWEAVGGDLYNSINKYGNRTAKAS